MTVRKSFPLAETQFYKEVTKRSGKVKRKSISQKKFERKARKANKDVWDDKPDKKVVLSPQGSYSPTGKTTKTKVIKKGDKGRKKTFVKESFEPGVKSPIYKKGGYILPSGITYK
tara:strand:- start:563 stop:907 length:345 start_codon:yes stop_codon:yes gene_type:complete